jgi:hypothetical protein
MMADDRELPPGQVIPAALAAGALTPVDVVHHGVLVEQVGRSHAVHRVSIGGVPRFFVKTFGPTRGATDGLAVRERAVLALAAERPAVAALVPELWPWNDAAAADAPDAWTVIATKAVAGVEAWTIDRIDRDSAAASRAWARLVGALAAPLAAFHRSTRDLARSAAPIAGLRSIEPWALCVMDGDAAAELWAMPSTATLLREAAADPALVSGLRAARRAWRPLALVHADLKLDNVLLESGGNGSRAVVLDWEMARIGDPAWDLALLTAHLAAARGNHAPWPDADLDATALLVSTYAKASGLAAPGLAHRQVLYAGAVLLMMALQHGATLAPGADMSAARSLIMKARATFHSTDRLTAALLQRVGPGTA